MRSPIRLPRAYCTLIACPWHRGCNIACPVPFALTTCSFARRRTQGLKMRTPILLRFVVVTTSTLLTVGPLHAQLDAAPPPAEQNSAAGSGFSWLCPTVLLAAVGGLYFAVRRRERAAEAEHGIRHELVWYCRQCDRDVTGSECPGCRTPNPFTHEPAESSTGTRTRRDVIADHARIRRDIRTKESSRPSARGHS
jgi:hypothetical protein